MSFSMHTARLFSPWTGGGTASSERVRGLFARDSLVLRLDVVSQTPSKPREWIYRPRVGAGLLAASQQGTALVLDVPRRLALLKVVNPTLRLDSGAPDGADVPFSVAAGEREPNAWLQRCRGAPAGSSSCWRR